MRQEEQGTIDSVFAKILSITELDWMKDSIISEEEVKVGENVDV